MLGLCDTAITGHLGSEVFLGAISVGNAMLNMLFWLFGFLRAGTTGITAKAFGAGDSEAQGSVFMRSLTLGLVIGILVVAVSPLIRSVLVALVGAEGELESLACAYYRIRIFEAPAMLGTMAVGGWFIGMQNTVWPMGVSVGVNVLNMLLSYLLAFVWGMGFVGTAWGTLISNWIGFALIFFVAFKRCRREGMLVPVGKAWNGKGVSGFFNVNSNLFIRSLCIASVSLGVTSFGTRMGDGTLAVNAVLMQFFMLLSFFMDGFAFSGEALVGKNLGAGRLRCLRKCVKALLIWSGGVCGIFTIVYGLGLDVFTGILTDRLAVREGVTAMRVWITVLPLAAVWAFIYDGFYIGITDTLRMMYSTLASTSVFFAVAFTVGGNDGLWTAFLAYLALRGIFLALMWPSSLARAFGREFPFNRVCNRI